MKKLISILLISLSAVIIVSCVDENDATNQNHNNQYFDFATTKIYHLNLDYQIRGEQRILFEVYKENPIDAHGNKIEGLTPLTKGFTDKSGKASFDVYMITGLKTVYVYTKQIGVPQVMEATVSNNTISFPVANITKAKFIHYINTQAGNNFWNTSIGMWVAPGYQAAGLPESLMDTYDIIPDRLLTDIQNTLPSGQDVFSHHSSLIKQNVSTKITQPANVYVTFLHENAEYRSSMGYFVYPTNPTATDSIEPILLFPNVSYYNAYYPFDGCLQRGDKIQLKYKDPITHIMLPTFPAGVSIGWVIVSDGFRRNSQQLGVSTVKKDIFYSLAYRNPETNSSQKQHCVLLYDQQTQLSIIGFEDELNSSGDRDFNDILFYASANPIAAIEPPTDHVVPSNTPAPVFDTTNFTGSLAYEDLWPYKGDYDMNDLVVEYNINQVTNTDNKTTTCYGYYKLVHVGAKIFNGFGFQLGVDDSKVSTFTLTPNNDVSSLITKNAKTLEAEQNLATAILFTNATDIINRSASARTYTFKIEFSEPVTNILVTPPFNPFIMINSGNSANPTRNHELHLPNYAPTSKMDTKLFGIGQDKSNVKQSLYYVSDEKFPFAIQIPTTYVIPTEMTRIDAFYPNFSAWVKSNGQTNTDWYLYHITANTSKKGRR